MAGHKGTCTVCRHTQSVAIDEALVAGVPLLALSKRYGLARSSLRRHRANHVAQSLMKAAERAAGNREDRLLGRFEQLAADARRLQHKAEEAKDYGVALLAIREITRLVELAARLQPKTTPEVQRLRLVFTPSGPKTVVVQPGVIDVTPEAPAESGTAAPETPTEPPVSEASASNVPEPAPERHRRNDFNYCDEKDREDDLGLGDKWGGF